MWYAPPSEHACVRTVQLLIAHPIIPYEAKLLKTMILTMFCLAVKRECV